MKHQSLVPTIVLLSVLFGCDEKSNTVADSETNSQLDGEIPESDLGETSISEDASELDMPDSPETLDTTELEAPDAPAEVDELPPGCEVDLDGDGKPTGSECLFPDCNDSDPSVHPEATEICDGVDQNCDDRVDEGLTNICGGCLDMPDSTFGQSCGPCSRWRCVDEEFACVDESDERTQPNECGGCGIIEPPVGTSCGVCPGQVWTCESTFTVYCPEVSCETRVVDISAAGSGAFLLLSDGTVASWGDEGSQELGPSEDLPRIVPLPIPGITGVTEIRSGIGATCFKAAAGDWSCIGYPEGINASPPSEETVESPLPIPDIGEITELAPHGRSSCALKTDGTVWCWGDNMDLTVAAPNRNLVYQPQEVLLPEPARSIAQGVHYACAVVESGRTYCWGENEDYTLGQITPAASYVPIEVPGIPAASKVFAGGYSRACVITETDREVWCWGRRRLLGGPTYLPLRMEFGAPMEKLMVGTDHVCGIDDSRSVRCTGDNARAQLGQGHVDPVVGDATINSLGVIFDIAGDDDYTCALNSSGQIYCWGTSYMGCLGEWGTARRPSLLDL